MHYTEHKQNMSLKHVLNYWLITDTQEGKIFRKKYKSTEIMIK